MLRRPALPFTFACFLVLPVACGDSAPEDAGTIDAGGSNGELDAGEAEPDAGDPADSGEVPDSGVPPDSGVIPDSGMTDCSDNPNDCVTNQLIGENCECLPECLDDLFWKPSVNACVVCLEDTDCPGDSEICSGLNFRNCNNALNCSCETSCDAFDGNAMAAGCDAGEACVFLGNPDLPINAPVAEGVCIADPNPTGGRQGDNCLTNDDCNRNDNFICAFANTMVNPPEPGACSRLCVGARQGLCGSFGRFECRDEFEFTGQRADLGLCLVEPANDIGTVCTMDSECDQLCSPLLGGSCTSVCGSNPLDICGENSVCATFNDETVPEPERSICLNRCPSENSVGDSVCRLRHPDFICDSPFTDPTLLVCFPPCTAFMDPCEAGEVCNATTGRCE